MKQLYAVVFLFVALSSYGQNKNIKNIALVEKATLSEQGNSIQPLFVHIDKNIYVNNERIWFSAYLFNHSFSAEKENILTVAVINTLQNKVYLSAKFRIQKGICFGALEIPDSIPPGQYQLHAHTNRMEISGKPVASLNQLIEIKSIRQQTLISKLEIMDESPHDEIIRAKLTIDNINPNSKQKPEVSYTLGRGLKKTIKPDELNQYIIQIPKKDIPVDAPILSTFIKHEADLVFNSLLLPQQSSEPIKVRFIPEGGVATNNSRTTIGWESLDSYGRPINLSGILKANDQTLDTISTNSYGMGSFSLGLENSKEYTLSLLDKDRNPTVVKVQLPPVTEDGITLNLPAAVVKDTVRIHIATKRERLVKVRIHDDENTYSKVDLPLKTQRNRLSVAIPELSTGYYTISVLAADGGKLAERLFFANKENKAQIVLSTDKSQYRKRDTVSLKLKVNSQGLIDAAGVISIACVQENRLSSFNAQNIENYYYLTRLLSSLPGSPNGRDLEDSVYLENIALLRTMSNSNSQSFSTNSFQEQAASVIIPALNVRVLKGGKPIKESVELSTFNQNKVNLFTTDSNGNIAFNAEELLTPYGTKQKLSVNVKHKEDYSILTSDPDTAIVNWVLNHDVHYKMRKPVASNTDKMPTIKGLENVLRLREVQIKASRDNSIYSTKPVGSNECGDYVDRNGYLNYPASINDPQNRPPVKGIRYIDGKRYTRENGQIEDYSNLHLTGDKTFTVAFITYEGCSTDAVKQYTEVDGVNLSEEFHPLNQEQLFSSEPQYLSTIFWQSGIKLDENGEYTVSFPTGDISGSFKIIIQGLHSEGIIYKEKLIEIK